MPAFSALVHLIHGILLVALILRKLFIGSLKLFMTVLFLPLVVCFMRKPRIVRFGRSVHAQNRAWIQGNPVEEVEDILADAVEPNQIEN